MGAGRLGPRHSLRFGDLRDWHAIEASCPRCRHVARLRPGVVQAILARSRGGDAGNIRVSDLEERLRCRECGNRRDNGFTVVTLPR